MWRSVHSLISVEVSLSCFSSCSFFCVFCFWLVFFFFCFCFFCFFFFSSRRRHTRSLCDWSSDVCSSDLPLHLALRRLRRLRLPQHQDGPPLRPGDGPALLRRVEEDVPADVGLRLSRERGVRPGGGPRAGQLPLGNRKSVV